LVFDLGAFEKHEKMLGKEREFHDGTIFKAPRSFNFFIKGAKELNINVTKITNLVVYRTLRKLIQNPILDPN
jgi:hypothetical protein